MTQLVTRRRARRSPQRPLLTFVAVVVFLVACSKPARLFLPAAGNQPTVHVPEVVAPAGAKTAKSDDPHKSWSKTGSSPSGFTMLAALPLVSVVQKALTGKKNDRNERGSLLPRASGAATEENVTDEVTTIVLPVLAAIAGWVALMHAIQIGAVALPGIAPESAVYAPIVATFLLGYLFITLEEQTEVNKAATALVLGILTWALVGTGLNLSPAEFETDIKESLEDVSEVVFFLLGALTIVEIMDSLKGFDIITKAITATNKRELLVVICCLTFFLSSVLNNLTVVIVMISLLQKVVKDVDFRMKLGGLVVVCSNAGGAWTPIGDITTTMMYIGGQVTTGPLIGNLFLPSVLCLIGTLAVEYLKLDPDEEITRPEAGADANEPAPVGQQLVFGLGLVGMVTVPVFTSVTQCPAWCGMMFVLGILGVITSLLPTGGDKKYNLPGALARVEVPDCLFFLGILFAVGALERIGLLKAFAGTLTALIPSDELVAILLGFSSAIVDNVPLVAASQGMYDLTAHPANSYLWNLICYCAATGGSLLVIGSAAGIAFMGMEKGVSFGWYVSNIGPAALVGYFCGIAGIIAQNGAGLSFH